MATHDEAHHSRLPLYKKYQDRFLRPLAEVLAGMNVTPSAVSVAGVLMMIIAASVMRLSPPLSVLFLSLSVIADFLDGTLARYEKNAPASGRIVDVITDVASFLVFISGLALAGFANARWLAVLAVLVAGSAYVNTMRAVRHAHETHTSQAELHGYWFFPNLAKFVCYASFIFAVIGGPWLLNPLLPALAVLLLAEIVYRTMLKRHA